MMNKHLDQAERQSERRILMFKKFRLDLQRFNEGEFGASASTPPTGTGEGITSSGEGQQAAATQNTPTAEGQTQQAQIPTAQPSQAEGQLYTIKVQGQEKQLPLEEIINLAQMGDDYTRKTQELSRERKFVNEVLQANGYNTLEEYYQAIEQQNLAAEAQQRGFDPEFYQEFMGVKTELSTLKREKTLLAQKDQLANQPFFKDWLPEMDNIIKTNPNADYDTAYTYLVRQKLPDIIKNTSLKSEQQAVKGLINNATTATGPVGGQAPDMKTGYEAMTPTERRAFREKVKRGEITP